MKRSVRVWLGDRGPVGVVRFEQRGARATSSFEYDPSWLTDPRRFPLEPFLPLVAGPQFPQRRKETPFHGVIADTGPDGWGRRVILRDHAKRREAARQAGDDVISAPLSELDFVLAVDDVSRMGSLRFQDDDGGFLRALQPGGRGTPPMIELSAVIRASHAVERNTETAADLAYLQGRGTSLGGMRPKCTLVDDDGALAIGKFPSVTDDRAVTRGEVLALQLARLAGIRAADARIVMSDDLPVAVIRRFDRRGAERALYVSAATMIGATDDSQEHAYTEIVDALRVHGSAPQADIEELWRRLVFSILITNVDDHLHNHGFLHDVEGRWRLSPAFDINPFPERHRELKTWISEEAGPEASIEAALSAAPYFRLDAERSRHILRHVDDAVAQWRRVGATVGMTAGELDAFADAFEHHERSVAKIRSR